jgi:hypothetical protein
MHLKNFQCYLPHFLNNVLYLFLITAQFALYPLIRFPIRLLSNSKVSNFRARH